ncbi:feruloyl-CoA synthase [Telluria aromaticivorans]|uniref:Feruloyl-CoA synthase n=1 Tax=Telluria aromaticivorans TaxID=2725995 RepID=A0A7Y2K139_9BURK|nr:feruloyl-CoA synthase [Telluria aromaticivorans]NNG23479.1 feruloyl-CoA synthase [Telluria aromaticivorans]
MVANVRYRPVAFGDDAVQVRQADGASYVTAVAPLGSYAVRTTDRLRHWAQEAPGRSFIARRGADGAWRHISYAEALQQARAIGQALLQRGLSSGRPVVILSGNDLEHAMLALACQYVGVPYAPISPAYSTLSQDFGKLRHIIELLNPGLVFASDGAAFGRAVAATCGADVEFVVVGGRPAGREATLFAALERTVPTGAVDEAMLAVGPDTIAKFLFTSGSTGLPKAVVNTHRMLCSNMQLLLQAWPFLAEAPPVLLDWLPWNHTFGGNKNVNLVLFNGGTLYIDDGKPTPQLFEQTLANLREIAPTIYFNVPKGWDDLAQALAHDPALRDTFYSRLKLQFYAGAALAQPVLDQLHAGAESACGERVRISSGLGMTETSPCALFAMSEDAQAGELGIPGPGMEVKLVPCGDKLELRYRGPSVTPGYWKAPLETAAMFDEEGFFRSGDAVRWLDPGEPRLGFVFDGRVAEDFKLVTGTWVSVGPLRNRVVQEGAPYVQDAVITGHDRSDIGLLIVPNLAQCRTLAGLGPAATAAEVLADKAVRRFFDGLVQGLGQASGSASRVARAFLLVEPPSAERGEVTDKGSVNQCAVLGHRAALVELLHAGKDPGIFYPGQDAERPR